MIKLIQGDCLEVLKNYEDNSVDAIVTDPPYGLSFMGKKWDYDVPSVEIWKECLRVLKPGAFLLSFAGSRTYHRIAINIENAGFEIRDMISWLYGSGFPKSYNIGKGIQKLKTQGNSSWNGTGDSSNGVLGYSKLQYNQGYRPKDYSNKHQNKSELTEEEAKQWEGWGTALKPAHEPIVVARKPLSEKNVALNVLKWGTGGINIDACRIGTKENLNGGAYSKGEYSTKRKVYELGLKRQEGKYEQPPGRFPANIILDEVAGKMLDKQTEGKVGNGHWSKTTTKGFGEFGGGISIYEGVGEKDKSRAGASRFFYCAKASKRERNMGCEDLEEKQTTGGGGLTATKREDGSYETSSAGGKYGSIKAKQHNNHPTVKPIKLMEYLIKLVSKEGTIILDPFMGSGTTGIACVNTNRDFIGIELDEDYCEMAKRRIETLQKLEGRSK